MGVRTGDPSAPLVPRTATRRPPRNRSTSAFAKAPRHAGCKLARREGECQTYAVTGYRSTLRDLRAGGLLASAVTLGRVYPSSILDTEFLTFAMRPTTEATQVAGAIATRAAYVLADVEVWSRTLGEALEGLGLEVFSCTELHELFEVCRE